MPIEPDVILLLVLAAFAAGFVDAIAGGGGLITLPALVMAGLSPVEAIATNKFQGTFGVATASFTFWRAGELEIKALVPAVIATLIGAMLGSLTVLAIDPAWLSGVLPVLLIAVATYFAFAPSLVRGAESTTPRIRFCVLAPALGAVIGFYDGFFGPGTGSFFLLGLVALGGLGLIKATASTKFLNFVSNISSFVVFAATGHILYAVGLAMAAGQITGARLGARAALKGGARLIRPLVVIVTLLIALKLLVDPANPAGEWLRKILT